MHEPLLSLPLELRILSYPGQLKNYVQDGHFLPVTHAGHVPGQATAP